MWPSVGWNDKSEPALAAPLLKAARRVARSSAYSRDQDQGWASPDDERSTQAALLIGWSVVFPSPPDEAANNHVSAWGD